MSYLKRALPRNPWKVSTLVLAAALVLVVGGERVPSAEAAGPARLSKALAALKASKKHLDEAKEPPAPFHAQSTALVGQAIAAVEREIKAYEANKEKTKDKDAKDKDGKDKDSKDKPSKGDKDKAAKKKEPAKSKPSAGEGNGGSDE